jgi:hypothetical protein
MEKTGMRQKEDNPSPTIAWKLPSFTLDNKYHIWYYISISSNYRKQQAEIKKERIEHEKQKARQRR